MDETSLTQQSSFFSPAMKSTLITAGSTAVAAYAGYSLFGKSVVGALAGAALGYFVLDPFVFMVIAPGGK